MQEKNRFTIANRAEKQPRRRRRKRLLFFILILLVLAIFAFTSLDVTYYEEENVTLNASIQARQGSTIQEEACIDYDYDYSYRWTGWDTDLRSGMMTPMMEVYNAMDRDGRFLVKFAFVKNRTYPWEAYNASVEKAVPAVWSKEQEVTIRPGESVMVTSATEMPEVNTAYWTYAVITPPVYHDCTITQKTAVTGNYTGKPKTTARLAARTMSLGAYLGKEVKKKIWFW